MPAPQDQDYSDSESSDHNAASPSKPKRRRLHGACDICRKKKIKCDSAITANNVCSNCINSKVECTHNIPRQKKRDTQQEYIRTLEERLRKMEELLRASSSQSPAPSGGATSVDSPSNTDLPILMPRAAAVETQPRTEPPTVKEEEEESADLTHVALADRIKTLSMHSVEDRFFGRSSMFSYAQQAINLRHEQSGVPPQSFLRARRPYFWTVRESEKSFIKAPPPDAYTYPDPDLLDSLMVIFWERVHSIYPVVHRPSFERGIKSRRYLTDPLFGMTVLAACAVASRYSDDPRVFTNWPLDPDEFDGSTAGWKYITQVPIWRNTLCDRTTMYDIQFFAMAGMYFLGSSMPQVAWHVIGLGLRLCQEKGIHRRKGPGFKPTVDSEAEKRAFWCLIASDRIQSSFLGRSPAMHDEDIDCDYPVECDDEYWEAENPADAFKQPPGKRSHAAAFTYTLKLMEIIGFMSRTLYSTKKSRILSGLVGEEWERRVVTQLDSSLNGWKDSLPSHLVWDQTIPDSRSFNQALFLHSTFFFIQIQTHRPFLSRECALSQSSRAICLNAARACAHACEGSMKRQKYLWPNVMMAAFLSAMVLTVNFWQTRGSRLAYEGDVADVENCRLFMAQAEKRWFVAGRLRDMITEFSIIRGPAFMPPSVKEPSQSNKRARSDDDVGYPQQNNPERNSHAFTASTMQPYSQYIAPRNERQEQQRQQQYHPQQQQTPTYVSQQSFGIHTQAPRNPPQQQQQQLYDNSTQAQAPVLKHTYPISSNEQWDLSSLLLAQMGYDQSPGNNFPVAVPTVDPSPPLIHMNISDQPTQHRPGVYGSNISAPRMMQMHSTGSDTSTGTDRSFPQDAVYAPVPTTGMNHFGFVGGQGGTHPNPFSPVAGSLIDMDMWLSASKPTMSGDVNGIEEWDTYFSTLNSGPQGIGVGTF